MTKEEVFITTVRLNTEEAKQKLEELVKKEKELKAQYEKVLKTGDSKAAEKAKTEWNKARKELNIFKTETMRINEILNNLSTASISQLNKASKSLNAQMKNLATNTQEFADTQAELKKVKERLAEIRREGEATGGMLDRSVNFLNKNWGAITQIIGTVTGLSATIRSVTNAYAEMEEAMADVQKYTGQTSEEVHEMNEEFKKMDTRTSREKLNALAGDAGRLGIQGKESIMEFVDAADKINVALGDDLGEDAVKNIGKLAQTFGEDKTKGLRGAMLATGSAVNELAQSSSADAGYITNFTARLAGVSTQANIAQTDIMGFASVLDQNMQQEETAATALSQLIAKMFQDPQKFAKLAGQDVKEFADLMRNDANKALLTFLSAMQKKGGFDALAPMFEEMGLSGTRATGVLSTLATKLGDVEKAQAIASQAYAVGTSVLKEYEVQNETVQAGIDRAKKEFNDMAVELGEDLLPIVKYTISASSLLVKAMKVVVDFVKNHATALISLTSAYAAYLVAAKADIAITATLATGKKVLGTVVAWSKLQFGAFTDALIYNREAVVGCSLAQTRLQAALTGTNVITKIAVAVVSLLKAAYFALTLQFDKASRAMTAFNVIVKMNPIGAAITVVLALVGAYVALKNSLDKSGEAAQRNAQRLRELSEAQKTVNEIKEKANQAISDEKTRLTELRKIVEDNTKSVNDRRTAIAAIQKLVPDYHASISNEGRLFNNNTAAIDKYVSKLNEAAAAQAAYDKLVELNKKKMDAEDKRDRKKNNVRAVNKEIRRGTKSGEYKQESRTVYNRATGEYTDYQVDNSKLKAKKEELKVQKESLDTAEKELQVINQQIAATNNYVKSNKNIQASFNNIVAGGDAGAGSTGGGATGSSDSKSGKKTDPEKEAINRSREIAKQQNAINEAEYATGMKLKAEFEKRKYEITLEELDRELAIYKKGTDEYANALAERQKVTAQQMHASTELQEQEIIAQADAVAKKLQMAFVDPTSEIYQNQAALDKALFENTVDALAKRRDLYAVTSQEYADLDAQILEEDNNNKLRLTKEYSDKVEQFKKEWLKKSDEEQKNETIRFLEELHDKGLVSEEQYQQMLKDIREKYDKAKVEENEFLAAVGDPIGIVDSFTAIKASVDALSEKLKEGKAEWVDYAAIGVTALSQISGMMGSVADLYAANCELEIAQTEAKYDKEIKAAGNNQAKVKKLEEQKKRDTNKIKIKQIDADAKVGIAQALINTALAVTKGYADYGPVLGSVLAAISVAMGAIQVATISKQAQAQKTAMQYYEGGYTGGNRYRKEAGIVHEGEFVANHFAVNNPAVSPVLDLIDYAQRNNTVGSLTRSDIIGAAGGGGQSQVVAPIVNVSSDNPELRENLARLSEAVELFKARLDEPIEAKMSMDRFDDDYRYYQRLKNSK